MPAAYSVDLRERVITLYNSGKYTQPQVANIFKISVSSVKMYLRLDRNGDSLERQYSPGRTPKLQEEEIQYLKKLVETHPDATLKWYSAQIKKETKKCLAISSIHRLLEQLGFTRKKKPLRPGTR